MRVLFVSLRYQDEASGGKVISDRNFRLLENYFGEENVVKFINTQEYLDLNRKICPWAFVEYDVVRACNKYAIDTVFLDISALGLFSQSFYRRFRVMTFFHNVELDYVSAMECKGNLKKWLRIRWTALREGAAANHSYKTIAINERTADRLEEVYGRRADHVLESSMEDRFESRRFEGQNGEFLLFVGADFFGNTDGLFPFITECMDCISIPLVVVGQGMDKYRDKFSRFSNVQFMGYVDDLSEYYSKAMAVVLPIISGSGMKTKTCEAFMYGKVVFGTDEAFCGYKYKESDDCILCNSNEDFIRKINDFAEKRKTFYSEKNRQLYLKYYSNKAAAKTFEKIMNSWVN